MAGIYSPLPYVDDIEGLLPARHVLREVADRLAELGYAQDAAAETEELLVILQQLEVRVSVRLRRLTPLWRALDRWDDANTEEGAFKKALATYRGDTI